MKKPGKRNEVNYRIGSILRIHVKNFVTYKEVICDPDPYLNVIIGPNGTGKSSIVAALILGLGGTPKTIGRGSRISEYVRNNCSEATINVKLQGDDRMDSYTITRKFNINNQTKWYINDEMTTEVDVKKMIKRLNIQVDNLCQFLPQDRVQDFARLNKKELLVNTQVAVGRRDLLEKQEAIILLQQEALQLTKETDRIKRMLEQTETEMSRLEGRVKNYKDRKIFLEDVDHINRKLSWKNYDKLTKKVNETREDLDKTNEFVESYKQKLLPLEMKINTLNDEILGLTNSLTDLNNSIKENKKRMLLYCEKVDNVKQTQQEHYCEMKVRIKSIEQSTAEIQRMEQKIDKLKNDQVDYIQQYGDDDAVRQKIKTVSTELNNFSHVISEIDLKRVDILKKVRRLNESTTYCQTRILEMENLKGKRLEKLRELDNDAHKGVLWLRDNKHLFQQQIYEPMMMELDVLNQEHSIYIESIIPLRDKVAFTCESREDMNLLVQTLRVEKGWSINALHSGAEHPSLSTYKSPIPIEQIRQYGFYAYANTLVKGPEPIMKYLCKMYKLHCIPIGDDTTYEKSDEIPLDIKVFFSSINRFSRIISRYSGELSVKITEIGSDKSLSIFLDQNEINQLQKRLNDYKKEEFEYKQKIAEIDNKKQKIQNERVRLSEQRNSLAKVQDDFKLIRTRLTSLQNGLKDYIGSCPKEEDIKNDCKKKIKNLISDFKRASENLIKSKSEYTKNMKNKEFVNININEIKDKITTLENEGQDLKEEYEKAKKASENIETILQSLQNEKKNALKTAKNLSDGLTPQDKRFDKFREKFLALPKAEGELQQLLEDLQIKIRLMSTADEQEIREYEKGLKLIEDYRGQLNEKQPNVQEIEEKRKKLFEEWIVPLKEMVEEINQNFSEYYESMGCAGEVGIHKENGEQNVADYGLAIRVTYRAADPLQELNQFVQSGGERAVATAIFMLSMQELTTVPFRCVDEINQGMDPENERRVFEILVKAACKTNSGQYFLVTPKLIPGLSFGDNMKIHIIHNSQFLETGIEIDLNRVLDAL